MTENKAKKNLELLERCYRVSKNGSAVHEVLIEFVTLEDLVEAIQALEEVQAYRAIGTVEELKTAMLYVSLAKIHGTVGRAIDACAEYESIGTIDEFKALKENSFFNFDSPVVSVDKKSYNKAIDEFAEKIRPIMSEFTRTKNPHAFIDVTRIAEQLKGGAE